MDEQKHGFSSAFNKDAGTARDPTKDIVDSLVRDNLIPFANLSRNLSPHLRDLSPAHFLFHVLGPCTLFACVFLDGHHMNIHIQEFITQLVLATRAIISV